MQFQKGKESAMLKTLRRILKNTLRPNGDKPQRWRRRLWLEQLGKRVTPATLTWTGSADHAAWGLAGNWDLNNGNVPGAGDTAVINATADNITTTVNTAISITTLNVNTGFTGTLTLNGDVSLSAGGQMTAAATITSNNSHAINITGGTFEWWKGTITSGATPSTITVSADAILKIDNTGADVTKLGDSVTVQSGGDLWLANTAVLKLDSNIPTIKIQSGGGMDIKVNNPANGAPLVPQGIQRSNRNTDALKPIDVQGNLTKWSNGAGTAGEYSIDEPVFVDGGTIPINASNSLRFFGKTGHGKGDSGGPDGNRGASIYIAGSTAFVQLYKLAGLYADSGLQMDSGTINCDNGGAAALDTAWYISVGNHFYMEGGIFQVGDCASNGYASINTGSSSFYWDGGTIDLTYQSTATTALSYLQFINGATVAATGPILECDNLPTDGSVSGPLTAFSCIGGTLTMNSTPAPTNWTGQTGSGNFSYLIQWGN
jgi:hypothetical protein